jgi:hypothetical protein
MGIAQHAPTSGHVVFPGGPVILLALVIIGVVIYVGMTRRRS